MVKIMAIKLDQISRRSLLKYKVYESAKMAANFKMADFLLGLGDCSMKLFWRARSVTQTFRILCKYVKVYGYVLGACCRKPGLTKNVGNHYHYIRLA